jgi:hypothetical protein
MLGICGLMGVVIFAVIYGFHERIASEQAKLAASNSATPQAGSAASALQGAPFSGLIPSASLNAAPASAPIQQQSRQLNPIEQAQLQAWTDYEQRKEAINTAHYQAAFKWPKPAAPLPRMSAPPRSRRLAHPIPRQGARAMLLVVAAARPAMCRMAAFWAAPPSFRRPIPRPTIRPANGTFWPNPAAPEATTI